MAQRLTLINFNFSPDCSGCTQILQCETIPSAQGRTGNSVEQEMVFTPPASITTPDSIFELSPFKEREGHTQDQTNAVKYFQQYFQLKGEKAFFMCLVVTQKLEFAIERKQVVFKNQCSLNQFFRITNFFMTTTGKKTTSRKNKKIAF